MRPWLFVLISGLTLLCACESEREKEREKREHAAKQESSALEPGTLQLSAEAKRAIGLKTEPASLGSAFDSINVTGVLDAERDRPLSAVSAPAAGPVDSLSVNVGDAVSRGQETARVAGRPVAAPAFGTVAELKVRTGDSVQAGQSLFMILNLSRLAAYLDIYEDQISKIRSGQRVELMAVAYSAKPIYGVIEKFSPQINPQTRAAVAEVDVENADGRLKPGMTVEARILLPSKAKRLMVPPSAVLHDSSGASWVYVQTKPMTYSRRRVDILPSSGKDLIVERGLKESELVVVQGAQELWGREFQGQIKVGEEEGEKDEKD